MKHILTLILATVALNFLSAQECNPYYDFKTGTIYELVSYDKKDRPQSYVSNEVISAENLANGDLMATFKSTISDKKKKEISSGEFTVKCEDGIYKVDVNNMIPQSMLQGQNSLDVEVEGIAFDIPKNLTKGLKLDDLETTIKMGSGGIGILDTKIKFYDRVIEGFETIKTPAGDFECVVISYTTESKIAFAKTKIKSKDYFAKGVGMVKSESFNKKGKLQSYTLLTKFDKP